MDAPDLIHRDV